jgi:hypothetical protein
MDVLRKFLRLWLSVGVGVMIRGKKGVAPLRLVVPVGARRQKSTIMQ